MKTIRDTGNYVTKVNSELSGVDDCKTFCIECAFNDTISYDDFKRIVIAMNIGFCAVFDGITRMLESDFYDDRKNVLFDYGNRMLNDVIELKENKETDKWEM